MEHRMPGAKSTKRAVSPKSGIPRGLIAAAVLAVTVGWYMLHVGPRQVIRTEHESLDNLKQLALALQLFLADHGDTFPSLDAPADIEDALRPYVKSEQVFRDPRTNRCYKSNWSLSGRSLVDVPDPPKMVCFYEENPGADNSRGAAFADGHASRVKEWWWAETTKAHSCCLGPGTQR